MNVWPVYRHSGCEGDYVRSAAHFTVPLNEGLIPTNDVGKCVNLLCHNGGNVDERD